ncbi:MAG TPA: branched-chain amino acid ABC transporter permease [Usitatibacter sp.]
MSARSWRPAELVFWLIPLAAFFLLPGYLVLGSQILIVSLFALSLDLILGYAGIVSLGHAAFFGLGAYTAGLLAVHGWGEPLSGLLAGGAMAALVGFVVSFLVVRGEDLARLMVTLGMGLLLFEAANRAAFITGGVDGLSGVVMGKVLGAFAFDLGGRTAYVYSFVVLFVVFVFLKRLTGSPFGLSLRGIRENPARMPALGAPVRKRLVMAYTVGAAIAGIAGALLAQTTQFVGLDTLGFNRSAELLIMLVLGGTGRLYGAIIGTAAFMIAQDYLSGVNPVYWQFWLGLLLVAFVFFARGGILGVIEALGKRLQHSSQERPR